MATVIVMGTVMMINMVLHEIAQDVKPVKNVSVIDDYDADVLDFVRFSSDAQLCAGGLKSSSWVIFSAVFSYASRSTLHPRQSLGRLVVRSFEQA